MLLPEVVTTAKGRCKTQFFLDKLLCAKGGANPIRFPGASYQKHGLFVSCSRLIAVFTF